MRFAGKEVFKHWKGPHLFKRHVRCSHFLDRTALRKAFRARDFQVGEYDGMYKSPEGERGFLPYPYVQGSHGRSSALRIHFSDLRSMAMRVQK